jgi:hypothetical protein
MNPHPTTYYSVYCLGREETKTNQNLDIFTIKRRRQEREQREIVLSLGFMVRILFFL